MKPSIPGMKSNHFPGLPVLGLESRGILHLGSGLFFPGWSKTSRRTRTRPGKAPMIVPGSSRALSMPDDEEPWSRVRIRPGKESLHIPASDQDFSGSKNEGYGDLVPENGDQVTENLPLKKRKMESAFPSTAPISNPNGPAIIHGAGFFQSGNPKESGKPGQYLRIQNPGPESSKEKKDISVVSDDTTLQNPARPRKNYVCDICNRAFNSYQALGGHKSHHNSKAHEKITSTCKERDTLSTLVRVERAEGRDCGPVHRCPFCDKVFLKGQALGGHKRHCRRALYSGPTGFSFDLNELPPEWVPEEMGGGTSG